MFEYLRGKLIENKHSYAVIDVHGVGYKVWIAPGAFNEPINHECTLYTSFVVRENLQALYGFSTISSRDLFEVLINISGIGPKTALCILSQFTPETFKEVIMTENILKISSVPGIGKKTAEKIIFDLKDKIMKLPISSTSTHTPAHRNHMDAIQALVNLGFSEKAASKAIETVIKNSSQQMELSEIITTALRNR